MTEWRELVEEAVALCDELPHIVVRPCIDVPQRSGFTVTIIAYRYPNTGKGTLEFKYGRYTGEWLVLRGNTSPKDGEAEDEQYVTGTGDTPESALSAAIEKAREKKRLGQWP